MNIKDLANLRLGPLEPLVARIYQRAKKLRFVREKLEAEYAPIMEQLRASAKPYSQTLDTHAVLPSASLAREDILAEMLETQ